MDLSEILSFKPETPRSTSGSSRASESAPRKKRLVGDDFKVPTSKRQALAPTVETPEERAIDERREKIERLVEETEERNAAEDEEEEGATDAEALDEAGLRLMLGRLEKKFQRNQEMRIKHPARPEKFMDSEVELHEHLQRLGALATAPRLYPIFVSAGGVGVLLQAIVHENADVSAAVLALLREMTDAEALGDGGVEQGGGGGEEEGQEAEAAEGSRQLARALLDGRLLGLLVQNLGRLDESSREEAQGVNDSLAIVENMVELLPSPASEEAGRQGVVDWLVGRLRADRPFDDNRLYCSELLSVLVQGGDCSNGDNRAAFGRCDGVDVLLRQLSVYRKRDPASAEEVEYAQNLFDVLCSSLFLAENRKRFVDGEGLHLVNLMLREKGKLCRTCALRLLDHATAGADGRDDCDRYVAILGLGAIFPLFMKTPLPHTKSGASRKELEEHVISTVASLARNCSGTARERLLAKFVEKDHAKVERLLELHFLYLGKAEAAEKAVQRLRDALRRRGEEPTEEEEEEFFLRRLDAGLFALQQIDYLLVEVCHSCPASVKERVLKILNMRGASVQVVKKVVREYADSMGDAADGGEGGASIRDRLVMLADEF